jgi:hypothetical protein
LASPSRGYFLGKRTRETDAFVHGGCRGRGRPRGSRNYSDLVFFQSLLCSVESRKGSPRRSVQGSAQERASRNSRGSRLLRAVETAEPRMRARGRGTLTKPISSFGHRRRAAAAAGGARARRSEGRQGKGDAARTRGGFEARSRVCGNLGEDRSDPSDRPQERAPA